MDNILVSVIIAAYNAEEYIRECIESVLSQTLNNIEVIVVNDGSSDQTQKIIDEYKLKDPRVVCISQPNKGAAAARNRGLYIAKGKYVNFFDADDIMIDRFLERAYLKAEKDKSEVVVCQSNKFYERDIDNQSLLDQTINLKILNNLSLVKPLDISENLYQCFMGWAWDKLFLTSFIKNNKIVFQEIRQSNDLFFTYYALSIAGKISLVLKPCVLHRYHYGSLENTKSVAPECLYLSLLKLFEQLKNKRIFDYYAVTLFTLTVNLGLWYLAGLNEKDKNIELYIKLFKQMRDSYSSFETDIKNKDLRNYFIYKLFTDKTCKVRFIKKIIEKDINNIIVYGVGSYGQFLLDTLLKTEVNIPFAIDQNRTEYKGISIKKMNYSEITGIKENNTIIVTVINKGDEIVKFLQANNSCRVLSFDDIVSCLFE